LHDIDLAAYVLTDWPFMQASRAAGRGVHSRIHLDNIEREPAKFFHDLAETSDVEIRVRRRGSDLMHLKTPAERRGLFVLGFG